LSAEPENSIPDSVPVTLAAVSAQLQKPGFGLATTLGTAAGLVNVSTPGRAAMPIVQLAPGAESSGIQSQTGTSKKATPTTSSPDLKEHSQAQAAQRSAQVLRQMRMHLHPGMRSATIQLAPADLGRLSIRLRVEGGEVHAVLRAETAEALGVLENHLPELEAAFEDQGFEEMTFEFVLDQGGSEANGSWPAGHDATQQLEQLIENKINPALRGTQTLSDIEVDTYA
jgi:flagellar hook-length control protein FliK